MHVCGVGGGAAEAGGGEAEAQLERDLDGGAQNGASRLGVFLS